MKGIFSSAPLFLFLLLLLVLAISAYFGESATVLQTEGFRRFSGETPLMGTVQIDDYSVGTAKNDIIKLYDNMYFDPKNANLIEVGGETLTKGNAESTGVSVTTISVYDRDGGKHGPYDATKGEDVPESATTKITPTYSLYTVASTNSDTNPLVLYASWSSDTFIHVFDLSTNKTPTSVVSAYFPINSPVKNRYYAWNSAAYSLSNTNTLVLSDIGSSSVADGKDSTQVKVSLYDPSKTPFQLCKQIYYDHTNGNLIFGLDDGSISVYNRPFTSSSYSDPVPQSFTSKSPMTSSEKSITTSGYYPMVVTHPNNRFSVYYVVNGANTILVVLANRAGVLSVVYSYFYQADGSRIMTKGQIITLNNSSGSGTGTTTTAGTDSTTSDSGTTGSGTDDANSLSDYYNWLAFWTTVAGAKDKDSVFKASNYIPKTAVVPPVCPSCAYCSGGSCGGGVCTNCGGQGGDGTGGGYSFADYLVKFGSGTKDLVEDTGSGATSLVRDAGAAGLGVLAVGAGLGVGAVKGGVGLAKETVGGAVGLAKETVGGTIGLAREAGSGIAGALKSNPVQINQQNVDDDSRRRDGYGRGGDGEQYYDGEGRGGRGTYTLPNAPLGQSGIDPYSYNGALVSKGGNYIPITSDFSAFGK